MVSVLPVVPVRKYCAVYYLAHDSYHGMEEVIGSIPIRSTKQFNNLAEPPSNSLAAFWQQMSKCLRPSFAILLRSSL
jgi:hypothetical protein